MKPKVVFITPSLGMGGAERWVLTLAKSFKNLNPYKIINLSGKYDSLMLKEAKLITNVVSENFYSNLKKLKIELQDADVVISWGYNAGLNLIDEFTFPSIDVSHSDPAWENHLILTKQTEKKSRYHVGVSKTATSSFTNKNAITIYNGIETNRLVEKIGRKEQRKIWGCLDKKVVLFLSRSSKEKNPEAVLEASKHFSDDWMFLFIESGTMLNIFNDVNQSNVKLIPKTENVGDYYSACDLVVMPSKIEGMPLILLESWYSKVPLVTSNYSTYKELKEMHGDLSWNIDSENINDLIKNIKLAYLAGRNCNKVVKAKEVVENFYTSDIMAKNWENYIFKLLENNT